MSFTVEQFEDLLRLLRERPEWRQRLLEVLLTEELLKLPVEFKAFRADFNAFRAEVLERFDRVEGRLDRVEARLGGVERELGRLRNDIGIQTETVAADVAENVLKQKGYRQVSRPGPLEADGELDLVWAVETPAGERLWVVLEAKYRLRAEDVTKFAQRFRSRGFRERLRAAGIPGPYLPYVFGLAADIRADERAAELGVGLVTARGEAVAPRGPET